MRRSSLPEDEQQDRVWPLPQTAVSLELEATAVVVLEPSQGAANAMEAAARMMMLLTKDIFVG